MARCKHYNFLTQMVTELPLVMANGQFRYLDCMQDRELETFLSYLIRFTSEKFKQDPSIKPEWWPKDLKFLTDFYHGTALLPYAKHKPMKLRNTIHACYSYFKSESLLILSEKLATRTSYNFERNRDDTATVFLPNTKTPIAVIPASNLDYDLNSLRHPGQLLNSGLTRRLSNTPMKKALISYDTRMTITVDDTDEDSDCMVVEESTSSEDDIISARMGITSLMYSSSLATFSSATGEHDAPGGVGLHRYKELPVVDLTLDEDEDEIIAKRELDKSRFLLELGLHRVGTSPPEPLNVSPLKKERRRSRYSLKNCSLDQIPFLVRIGFLPKRCLATEAEICKKTAFIDKYTKTS